MTAIFFTKILITIIGKNGSTTFHEMENILILQKTTFP
jgi:hypothetical protein